MMGPRIAFLSLLLAMSGITTAAAQDSSRGHMEPRYDGPPPPSHQDAAMGSSDWGTAPFPAAPFSSIPHLVLQPPPPPKHAAEGEIVITEDAGLVGPADPRSQARAHTQGTGNSHFLHADKMPRPVGIPGATRLPVWKTPYSYGHFGASRTRQWSLHRGHQQSFMQWTLR